MIEKLTEQQISELPKWRDMWLDIGLSTAPIDEGRCKAAVSRMYECAGLKAPSVFIFLDSPQQGAVAAAMLKDTKWGAQVGAQVGDQVGDQVRAQVWDQVGAQVWAQVGDQVGAQVGDQVRAQVRAQVWAQVGDQVGDQVRAQVWDQVRAQVWDQVGAQVWAQVGDQVGAQVRAQVGRAVYGSHDASWLSFHHFFNTHFDLSDKASGLFDVARECGWVWPFEGCAIITARPDVIRLSEDKLLHCEDGPAVRYRDGFSVYAWHGVRVPGEWIENPEGTDPADVIKTENVEQRAAGCAILGWPRMADKLDRKIIDGNPDSDIGALIELTMPGLPDPGRFLMAKCPRNGTICEGVPRNSDIDDLPIDTAIAAQAWRDCLPQSEYIHPTTRT